MFSSVGWSCQCCQPFPLWCALQSPGHSWACASLSPVCLCRGGTELRAALQMWSCQCWVGGIIPLLLLAPLLQMQLRTSLSPTECIAGLCSLWCPVGPPGSAVSQQVSAQSSWWGYLRASHFPVWSVWGSCQPLCAACQGPLGWPGDPLVPQPVLPVCVISQLAEIALGPIIRIISDGVDQYWIEPTIDSCQLQSPTQSQCHLLFGIKCLKAPAVCCLQS